MNKSTIAKICGGLCILGAILVFGWTCLDLGFGITNEMVRTSISAEGESSDKKIPFIIILGALNAFTLTMFFGFAGFFFSGAFNKKLAGKILFGIVATVTAINFLVLILGLIYFILLSGGSAENPILSLTLLSVPFFQVMLLAFGVTSLIIGKAKILKSLIPLTVFVFYLLTPILFGVMAVVFGKGTLLYDAALQATVPHWLLFGSICWVLMGVASFIKNKEMIQQK